MTMIKLMSAGDIKMYRWLSSMMNLLIYCRELRRRLLTKGERALMSIRFVANIILSGLCLAPIPRCWQVLQRIFMALIALKRYLMLMIWAFVLCLVCAPTLVLESLSAFG